MYEELGEQDNSVVADLTEDIKEAFRGAQPDHLNSIWDAFYVGGTDDWTQFVPHPALRETLETYAELFTGAVPRLTQLSDWIGHGFG